MLGLRGVRLLLVHPEVDRVQVRALAEAVARLAEQGRDIRPEVMLPLVAEVAELTVARERLEAVIAPQSTAERGSAMSTVPWAS